MTVIRTILVEDEEDIRFIVKVALERSDAFEITAFASGSEALDHLARDQDLYDLALVNFRLPGMHGLDFLRRARSLAGYEHLPAIIISAALIDPEMRGAEEAGLLGMIPKPFRVHDLPRQVLDLFSRAEGAGS